MNVRLTTGALRRDLQCLSPRRVRRWRAVGQHRTGRIETCYECLFDLGRYDGLGHLDIVDS